MSVTSLERNRAGMRMRKNRARDGACRSLFPWRLCIKNPALLPRRNRRGKSCGGLFQGPVHRMPTDTRRPKTAHGSGISAAQVITARTETISVMRSISSAGTTMFRTRSLALISRMRFGSTLLITKGMAVIESRATAVKIGW